MSADAPVLVVEDDDEIREILCDILEDHGYPALSARDGREALDLLSQTDPQPRLILLDLMMPVMDGKDFRRAQLCDPKLSRIPVVLISAFRDLTEALREMQPAAHLHKPLNLSDLLDVVRRHGGEHRPA